MANGSISAFVKFKNLNGALIPYDQESRVWLDHKGNYDVVDLKESAQESGSLSMLATWRMWMGEAAKHMSHMGCTMPLYFDSKGQPHGTRPFNADDAHALFTMNMLGADKDGNRLSWKMSKADGEKIATKEQRLFAMDKFVVWATERGVLITIPRLGEYADYREAQE